MNISDSKTNNATMLDTSQSDIFRCVSRISRHHAWFVSIDVMHDVSENIDLRDCKLFISTQIASMYINLSVQG